MGSKLVGEAAGRSGAPEEPANESFVGKGIPVPGCWLFARAFIAEWGLGQQSRARLWQPPFGAIAAAGGCTSGGGRGCVPAPILPSLALVGV